MLRKSSYLLILTLLCPAQLLAQPPVPDTVRALSRLHEVIVAAGPVVGPRVWPGFRPDTIATLYVIPNRAKLFARWPDTLPAGFFPLPGVTGAAWTDTRTVSFPRGRPIAFLSVDSTASEGSVLGLALHEQFHAFQRASSRRGRRFGAGENSMLVATYPSFDVDNEAAFALEGRTLARALRARSPADAGRLAREFLAARERRRARLDSALVGFEAAAELNEGLAQYALISGLRELARGDARRFGAAAADEASEEAALLDSLLVVGPRSIRRRFYATGSAIALLLDRLADSSWKSRLVRDDATLERALAAATGYGGRATLGARSARRADAELARLRREAEAAAAALGARRRAQRDSVLARPGLRVVIDPSRLSGGKLSWCFFDPQNVLQTAAGELLHMRMLRACSGGGVEAEFSQPVVEHRATGALRAVVGEAGSMTLSGGGARITLPADGATLDVTDLRIEGPTFRVVAPRATVERRGEEVWVVLGE